MKIELGIHTEYRRPVLNRLKEFPENKPGIIREWGASPHHIGKIVVRRGNTISTIEHLITDLGSYWNNYSVLCEIDDSFFIEVLPKESVIKITVE